MRPATNNIRKLRAATIKEIQEEYPYLQTQSIYKLFELTVSKYYLPIILLSQLLLIAAIVLLLPKSPIQSETARILIDQRAANYAAIAGTTIAIIGFSLSNIVKKKSFYYQLMFEKSFFIPIIAYTLISLATIILISTTRDLVLQPYLPNLFGKLVLGATITLFIGIALIFHLFRTVAKFVNENQINEYLMTDVIYVQKRGIFEQLIRAISKRTMADFTKSLVSADQRYYAATATRYVYDIDLKKLEKYIAKNPDSPFPYELHIGSRYPDSLSQKRRARIKATLNTNLVRAISLRKRAPRRSDGIFTYFAHLDQELNNAITENNMASIQAMLKIYYQVFKIYSGIDIKYYTREDIIACWTIREVLHKAIRRQKDEHFRIILQFIEGYVELYIESNNSRMCRHLIDSIAMSYSIANQELDSKKLTLSQLNTIFNLTIESLKSIAEKVYSSLNENIHTDKINMHISSSLCLFIRCAISNNNANHLKKVQELIDKNLDIHKSRDHEYLYQDMIEVFNKKIPHKYEAYDNDPIAIVSSPLTYVHHLTVLARLWIHYLYNCELLTQDKLNLYLNYLGPQKCYLVDILFFTQYAGYFDRLFWNAKNFVNIEGHDEDIFDKGDWILQSFAAEKLLTADYELGEADLPIQLVTRLLEDFKENGVLGSRWIELTSEEQVGSNHQRIVAEIEIFIARANDTEAPI